jgi:hypothetical protein
MKAARVLGVALSVLGVGCSASRLGSDADSGSPPATGMLDCDWLASDNCLKATLTAAMSCVEPSTEIGVFNADNTTCTYPSGVVIAFDAPVKLPLGLNPPGWHFSVTRAGAECLRFDSLDNVRLTLTVNGNTLTNSLKGTEPPLTITCPDGNSYTDSTDGGLLYCQPGVGFGGFQLQRFERDLLHSAVPDRPYRAAVLLQAPAVITYAGGCSRYQAAVCFSPSANDTDAA